MEKTRIQAKNKMTNRMINRMKLAEIWSVIATHGVKKKFERM